MPAVLRRLLLVLAVAFGGALGLGTPAAATTPFTMSVSIAGDSLVPQGAVLFCKVGDTSCQGNNLSGGSLTKQIATLDEGDYRIKVSLSNMDGYTRFYKQGAPQGTATEVDATVLTFDGNPVNLSIEFPQIAHLHGRVTNSDGSPVPSQAVLRNRLGSGSQRTTDVDGYYDWGYVQAGNTTVSVNGSGNWGRTQQTLVMPASGDVEIDLVRPELARLTGTVTDAVTGDPIPNIRVAAFVQASVGYATSTMTDASGTYMLEGLGSGPFILQYEDPLISYGLQWNGGVLTSGEAAAISVTPGATTVHDESLTAKPDPRGLPNTVGGIVTDGQGAPVPDIEVDIFDPATPGFPVAYTATDRLGRWGTQVPEGSYRVGFVQGTGNSSVFPSPTEWYPEFYPDAWGYDDAGPVTVPPSGSEFGVDVQLTRSATLTVNTKDSAGSSDLNAGYRLLTPAGASILEHAPQPSGSSQLYLLLRPGSYKLLILGARGQATNDPPLVPAWYEGGISLATAKTLTLAPGQVLTGSATLPRALKALTKPAITGTPKKGKRLKVGTGTWNQLTGTTFGYRWLRGTTVVGTKKSYVVTRADIGKTLTAEVTATNATLSTSVKVTVKIKR